MSKKRTSKTSRGERRSSRPVRLTYLEKALLGKGRTANFRPMSKQETDDYLASRTTHTLSKAGVL